MSGYDFDCVQCCIFMDNICFFIGSVVVEGSQLAELFTLLEQRSTSARNGLTRSARHNIYASLALEIKSLRTS